MKGSIRQLSKDRWEIRLYLGVDKDGKHKYKSQSVRGTKKQAEAERIKLVALYNSGGMSDPSSITVEQYLSSWIDDHKSQVSAKTHERYAELIKSHITPALGSKLLQKLKPTDIQNFYTKAGKEGRKDGKGGLSPQTVVHIHRILKKALADAVRRDLLVKNPAERADPPKVEKREMMVLDMPQVIKLLETAKGTRFYIPAAVAAFTGMRRGEILALRWKDVSLNDRAIAVTRTLEQVGETLRFKEPKSQKSKRLVLIPKTLAVILSEELNNQKTVKKLEGKKWTAEDLICTDEDGKVIKPDDLSDGFRFVVDRAKIPKIRFHDLRHTHATLLLASGEHAKIVSERLGHSTIAITMDTYSHVLPTMQKGAVDKLDKLVSRKNMG